MYYTNLFNQLSFSIFTCFSFFIFIFNLLLNKEKTFMKLFGLSFFIPFSLNIASFLFKKEIYSNYLFIFSETAIFFILFLLLKFKPGIKFYKLVATLIFITPILIFSSIIYFPLFNKDILEHFYLPFIMLLSLFCMFILSNKKGIQSLLFWAALCELTLCLLKILDSFYVFNIIEISLRLFVFILFIVYFYKEIYKNLMRIVDEADKKLTAVNKNLNLEVKKRVFEIELSNEKLIEISKTDSLTKALNIAGTLEKIDSLINSKKYKEFCIVMFDIDNFKSINDNLGHITGDKCLKKLSLLAKSNIRDVDNIGRYGGDEFIIVLPGATVPQTKIIAERFRKNVAATDSPHFTISMGIASFPTDGLTVKELISVADEGLYVSKKKGKNSVSYKTEF